MSSVPVEAFQSDLKDAVDAAIEADLTRHHLSCKSIEAAVRMVEAAEDLLAHVAPGDVSDGKVIDGRAHSLHRGCVRLLRRVSTITGFDGRNAPFAVAERQERV